MSWSTGQLLFKKNNVSQQSVEVTISDAVLVLRGESQTQAIRRLDSGEWIDFDSEEGMLAVSSATTSRKGLLEGTG